VAKFNVFTCFIFTGKMSESNVQKTTYNACCSGKIWGMERDKDGQWQMQEMLDTQLRPTGAGEGEDGTLYVTTATPNYGGPVDAYDNEPGSLWRLVEKSKVADGVETVPLD
jgi:hypothetical protein